MRFMVLVQASPASEAGELPTKDELTKMGQFNDELVKAGVMLAGEGLQASSKGARINFTGGRPAVVEGPFTESKELVAGFWIIQVKSKEEAIELMKRAPFARGETIEIRQIFEMEDFDEAFTPELREQETRQRAAIAAQP